MATFLNHMPATKSIGGLEFYRGEIYDSERDAAIDRHSLKSEYFTRLFWTGGEKLSDGTTRKTFFLMVYPKPGRKTARVTVAQIKADGLDGLLEKCANFSRSGSIIGMRKQYYGQDAMLLICGSYIYNVTPWPALHRYF